ncbi:chemotaxis-specific protein-glutamate methyltransferase CheB [Desulfomonile tiedjei]|uniref:Protein-glutamate methylesterase/protein-glutamine glutaminase n=1 Tax=Desulfomonile tiedjei (strain ATCC 49306 / DSM 6799 / DCB-1) TaxID=706587 RepID=I4BZQ0_DESTA|nr:chemotaxis-specific protein-glutamate methyltransferase CheB [Desulfomonile tiedjei]AFM22791.1 chemotaxis response regulator containing a CheY-like receiver domain and a methylesterase domain [Desulfomonile tiedjei DSM 6799]
MIKVLVVEDSPVALELLKHILSSDPEITVVGTATNGLEAVEFVQRERPDVVTMDIIMPKMDGFEATRQIMGTCPVPIVIVSASLVREEVEKTWRAVEAGAVAVLEKPRYVGLGRTTEEGERLVQTVKLMSQVKVVRRWNKASSAVPAPKTSLPSPRPIAKPDRQIVPVSEQKIKLVAIGASTGGPPVLQQIFSSLPLSFPAPILLVQHISPGFTHGFVDWLNRTATLQARLADDGERIIPGNIYVAPDGHQMKVDAGGRIILTTEEAENGIRPSISYLFRSVAHAFGAKSMGILLTGMGRDGADELKTMRDKGALTIAQDKESSIVYGMPMEAVRLGAAQYSLPPDKIIDMLMKISS